MSPSAARGPGRRAGPATTRAAIATAARDLFATHGYAGSTLRAIAERAAVDPALIAYFFGSKRELFLEVVELPVRPDVVVPQIIEGDPEHVGERIARFVLSVLGTREQRGRVLGLLRTAAADEEAAALVREKLTLAVLEPVAAALGHPDARLRAGMVMSQIVGFAMAREVVGLDVLRDSDDDALVRALAPTLQRYLVEPWD